MLKKRLLASAAALAVCGAAIPALHASAAAEAKIVMSVANAGKIEVAAEEITVRDCDGDGALTVYDAISCVHEEKLTADGFAVADSEWGKSITKLWGVENGGSYGYTVNNRFAFSLTDPVKEGDYVYAYVFQDAATYTDKYSFFDITESTLEPGSPIMLTLKTVVFGADGSQSEQPYQGAAITVNGEKSALVTDEEGHARFAPDQPGSIQISAVSDSDILVPAVLNLRVLQAPVEIRATLSNAGTVEFAREKLFVRDCDADGALTVYDAIFCAHEEKFDGGAAAGFAVADSEWGKSITKLWGVENGGSYGYTVNDKFAFSLTDPVKEGDELYAYVFKDAATYSDQYSFFTDKEIETAAGSPVMLTLKALSFGADGSMSENPVAGAVISFNGTPSSFKTEADGMVRVALNEPGTYTVSAASDTQTLVPPVLTLIVKEAAAETQTTEPQVTQTEAPQSSQNTGSGQVPGPQAGDHAPVGFCVTALAMLGAAAVLRRKHEN